MGGAASSLADLPRDLTGWHIERGYMWPCVLLTYLLTPVIVGWLLHPGRRGL
jgi:hypothetical protein